MLVFTVSVQLFYLTNMLFSLVIIYAMHHFARYDKENETLDDVMDRTGGRDDSVVDMNFRMMFLRSSDGS